jgi:hypothetical protein
MSEENNVTSTLTFGEIAYNAYCAFSGGKSLVSGADLPAFSATTPGIQDAWQAAAQAVLNVNSSGLQAAA